jgi:catalase
LVVGHSSAVGAIDWNLVVVEDKSKAWHGTTHSGVIGRYAHTHPNDNYEQPRALFRKVYDDDMRKVVMDNIAGGLGKCRKDIQERMIPHFFKIDEEYGAGIAQRIGLPVNKAKL